MERASAHPEPSMTAISTAPSARLRAGTAASQRAWRTGSSTRRSDSAESAMASATAASRWDQVSGPQRASANTSTGQCQR